MSKKVNVCFIACMGGHGQAEYYVVYASRLLLKYRHMQKKLPGRLSTAKSQI